MRHLEPCFRLFPLGFPKIETQFTFHTDPGCSCRLQGRANGSKRQVLVYFPNIFRLNPEWLPVMAPGERFPPRGSGNPWPQNCSGVEKTMQAAISQSRPPRAAPGRETVLFWLKIATVLALIALLYSRILAGMAHDWWTQPAWSHGLLIPPLALYVAWIRRASTLAQPPIVDGRGLLVVIGACLCYIRSEERTSELQSL